MYFDKAISRMLIEYTITNYWEKHGKLWHHCYNFQ